MKAYLISQLIKVLLAELAKHAPGLVQDMADSILDFVEDKVVGSASKADDAIVLPICEMLRESFKIPDND